MNYWIRLNLKAIRYTRPEFSLISGAFKNPGFDRPYNVSAMISYVSLHRRPNPPY
jgi:hypothetical protein